MQERLRRFRRAVSALRSHEGLPPLAEDLGLPTRFLVVRPTRGQTVYRVVGRSEPTERDFFSDRDKDREPAPRQDFIDFVGISVFGSQAAALESCVRFPKLVATVRLSPNKGFTIARTEADIDEHYSVWGDSEDLRRHVLGDVFRVDAPELD